VEGFFQSIDRFVSFPQLRSVSVESAMPNSSAFARAASIPSAALHHEVAQLGTGSAEQSDPARDRFRS